jgi:hypothetical protein
LTALTPDPSNVRRHPALNRMLIEESLREVGAARSIVVDEDNVVLAGVATWQSARALGFTSVRVVESDGTDLVAVRRRNLGAKGKVRLGLFDNRSGEESDWDEPMLGQLAQVMDLDDYFSKEQVQVAIAAAQAMREQFAPAVEPSAGARIVTMADIETARHTLSVATPPPDLTDVACPGCGTTFTVLS